MGISYPVWDSAMFAYTISAHIIIVGITLAMALLITIAEYIALKRKNKYYEALAHKLSIALVINFAIGTASGVFMAVELMLFWPVFMRLVGAVAMLSFYAEVFAFLVESITLMVYVYFWDNFKNRWNHWLVSWGVLFGTGASAWLITNVNAWMNTPTGSFNIAKYISSGGAVITGVNPLKVFDEPSTGPELFHMFMAMYFAGSMALLAYFAYKYLKSRNQEEKKIDRSAMKILSAIGIVDIILIGISGSIELSTLLVVEPLKYAMLELNMHPVMSGAPEHIFGFIVNGKSVDFIPLAGIQSLLAYPLTKGNAGYIPGLSSYPSYTWAPSVIHDTLDLMVGFGLLMGLFWFIVLVLRLMKKDIFNMKWVLYGFIGMGFLGMFTMEDGWYTAEVGRVPYIILMPYNSAGQPIIAGHYGVMTIAEAASTSTIVWYLGIVIILFYLIIIPFTFYFNAKVLNLANVDDELRKAEKDLNINSSGQDINSVNVGAR
ncbi:MAG: cytochrome ubiquinol oxidase subunit I [Ferroplasma sp.]|uniref:cytochrome ubiquinol oxidase subunit I n=1 Tax=Ferroplasma sp. TaxID=2591003 RepID=UPI002816740D|nr:cytochrome ubiquinol oxidase subunit I [Ferroplasma sp.]WMT51778.1 MAG: cytochrome ubiquinol oxidase subunit I [Ferroplasma sp.]